MRDNRLLKDMMFNVFSVVEAETESKFGENGQKKIWKLFKSEKRGMNRYLQVLEEIQAMESKDEFNQVKWDELIKELNRLKGDKSLKTIDSFRQMVKTYTNNGVYYEIGKKMRTSQFEDIQSYCASIVQGI